jgi:hypothetical protein
VRYIFKPRSDFEGGLKYGTKLHGFNRTFPPGKETLIWGWAVFYQEFDFFKEKSGNFHVFIHRFLTGTYEKPWDVSSISAFIGFGLPNTNQNPNFSSFDFGGTYEIGTGWFQGTGVSIGGEMLRDPSNNLYKLKWLYGLNYFL